MSPTQRSLKRLREAGATCAIVEKYNSFIKIRQDLFGFIDLLALDEGAGVLGVQTTSAANLQARVRKVTEDRSLALIAKLWLGKGNRLEFHGWRKAGTRWVCRVIDMTMLVGEAELALQVVERAPTETEQKILSRRKINRRDRSAGTPTA